jgi:homoisocitrate dehydrogenase
MISQYVKRESIEFPEEGSDVGRIARAERVISERATRRIGITAFDIALERPRKVRNHDYILQCSSTRH